MRPVLIPSREEDSEAHVGFGDGFSMTVAGHGGACEVGERAIYLALGLRNGGAGLAVIHGWRASVASREEVGDRPDPDEFQAQQLDLYIPAGETGYWLGAMRDPDDRRFSPVQEAARAGERVIVDLMYGDHEGGQRTIARFSLIVEGDNSGGRRALALRYWNLDREDPRDPH